MTRITITLRNDERKALIKLADLERRNPREQAAYLLRCEMQRRGLVTAERDTKINYQTEESHGNFH